MAKPKTSFRFTAAAIDRIKPPEAGRIDYSNTALPGMQLRVSAARLGKEPKKVYRVKTRIAGKQVPMTLGSAASCPWRRRARGRGSSSHKHRRA